METRVPEPSQVDPDGSSTSSPDEPAVLHESSGRRALRAVVKYGMPLLIIAGAIRLAMVMIANRPEPEMRAPEDSGALVEVIEVEARPERLDVSGQGTVVAARQVRLQPQVSGRVEWVSPDLVWGGTVQEGQELLRLEDRDYRLVVQLREAERERAEVALTLEQGRQVVAQREWDLFRDRLPDDDRGRALALREPQQRDAEQVVEMSEAALDQARLDLRRTTLRAPFNGYVEDETVEVGQFVSPNGVVATLVGTDHFWVRVNLPVDRVSLINIPGVNAAQGSRVRIGTRSDDGGIIEREGRVVRLMPSLDPVGRLARILVEVEDPMLLARLEDERDAPLFLNSFVHVDFEGNESAPLIEIPRAALHGGDQVWVMTADSTLAIHTVEIAWRRRDTVLVSAGLSDGDQVVLSPIGTPVEGMQLRTEVAGAGAGSGDAPAPAPDGPAAQVESGEAREGDEQPAN